MMSMTPGDDDRQVSLSEAFTKAESEFSDLDSGTDSGGSDEQPWEAPSWTQRWKPEARDALGRFARVAKQDYEHVVPQLEEMNGYITRRDQEYAQYRQRFDPLWQVIAPFEQRYALQGIPVHQGVQQLFQAAELLNTNPDQAFPWLAGSYRPRNPQEAIMRLAQSWGVDLNTALADQPYIDPTVTALLSPLQQQVQQMQHLMYQQQASSMQQQHSALVSEISDFEAATDENGNLLHPHFAAVFDDMVKAIQFGHAKDLPTAYSMAVQFNPQAAGEAAEAARKRALKDAAARTAATEKSESASRKVAGKSHSQAQRMHLSIKEGIAKAAAELGD